MTLAHKNTSKWARRVLRRGAKMDVEERRALSLQIAKGEELRRKVMGEDGEDGDDESGSETEEGLLRKARDILMENGDDGEDDDEDGGTKKGKGLFQLEFMKRGMEVQRKRAKEEARKLLEELEANELAIASYSTDDEDDGEEGEKRPMKKPKKRVATEAETGKVLPEGKLVAVSLQFGKADGFSVKVDGNIELGGDGSATLEKTKENDDATNDEQEEVGKGKKSRRKRKKRGGDDGDAVGSQAHAAVPEEEEENPWIVSKSTKKSSKPSSKTVNINEAASMLVDNAQEDRQQKRKPNDDPPMTSKGHDSDNANEIVTAAATDEKEVGIAELSQAELVRRAFAAPADLEAEEEFQKEKVSS